MKIKIQIKSVFGKLLFEYEKENNTILKTLSKAVEICIDLRSADLRSADLRYADLSYVNLRSADLRYANLSYANLRYANLSLANLSYADLSYVDLRSADLSYAKTDKRYIQISCVGSENRKITYCFDDDIIWYGCFIGNLREFEDQVKKIHNKNNQYLSEYLGFIEYIKNIRL